MQRAEAGTGGSRLVPALPRQGRGDQFLLPPKAVSYWLLPLKVAIPARVAALAPKNWPWVVPATLPLAVAVPANEALALLMLALTLIDRPPPLRPPSRVPLPKLARNVPDSRH